MKRSARRLPRLFVLILAVGFASYVLLFYRSAHSLQISAYSLPSHVSAPVRIVQLSDLHNSQFGPGNQRLLDAVAQQEPDLIFLTGDLVNDDDPNLSIALDLVRALTQIAPVYASYGNHELNHEAAFHTDLAQAYQQAGATFLDQSWTDCTVGQTALRIGGVYSYCLPPEYVSGNAYRQEVCDFLTEFQDTQLPTLLLCHLPVSWLSMSLDHWAVDVVFSGHLHGGQIVLPGLGGVYAPDMGWFPGRMQGVFWSQDLTRALVLSSGLGSAESIPRVNNIPQVVVVELHPSSDVP